MSLGGSNPIKCWGCNSSVEWKHGKGCPNSCSGIPGKIDGPWADSIHDEYLRTLPLPESKKDIGSLKRAYESMKQQARHAKPSMGKHLPTDAKERKKIPLYSGLMKYFPDALVEVARLSYIGNEQHNPGQKLHWAREKSTDQEDTAMRHLLESGTVDTDGVRHTAKAAWRVLAMLQLEIEAAREGK